MHAKSKDIIFLLGAGASAEAGIPVSAKMIEEIEKLFDYDDDWEKFKPLYNHVKSAIFYSAGLRGDFNTLKEPNRVNYNIEVLANTLFELAQNEQHPVYPFVATWNVRFQGLAGNQFEHIKKFREKIVSQLLTWTKPKFGKGADYFKGFKKLKVGLQFPLKVFTLNYDLSVEKISDANFRVETGFEDQGENYFWEWKRFDDDPTVKDPPDMFLYKLHGSINWLRDKAGNLYEVTDPPADLKADQLQVIFGKNVKLEAGDPYLFYAFEFRKSTLEAKLVFALGYGFGDDHINKMLTQAMVADPTKKIVIIAMAEDDDAEKGKIKFAASRLAIPENRFGFLREKAKTFLESADIVAKVMKFLPEPKKEPF